VLTVTQATEADVPALALLMDELDRFYGAVAVDSPEQREEQIRDALSAHDRRPTPCLPKTTVNCSGSPRILCCGLLPASVVRCSSRSCTCARIGRGRVWAGY